MFEVWSTYLKHNFRYVPKGMFLVLPKWYVLGTFLVYKICSKNDT